MKIRLLKEAALAAATIAAISLASADAITIPNPGFEVRGTYDPFAEGVDKYNQFAQETWRHFDTANNGGPLRIWNPGPAGAAQQGIADVGFEGNAPEGDYVVVVRSRYNDNQPAAAPRVRDFEAAVQLLADTFDPTMTYTLTAKVGRLPEGEAQGGSANYSPSWFGYALQLAVGGEEIGGAQYAGQVTGGTVIAEDLNSVVVPMNTFVTATVTYTPNPADADLAGERIQVRLCALENPDDHALTGWVAFDDVALDASSGPIAPFAISEFVYTPADGQASGTIRLTWPSREGQTFYVKYSTDMTNWDSDLDDGVMADAGTTTTRTYDIPVLPVETGKLFFRIEQQ